MSNVGDARFVDAAGGDYRLRFDSPLIDVGAPGAPTTSTDLAGFSRLVDGDGVPGARRDIGAYEYQAQSPLAAIAGPTTAQTAEQVTFSGEESSDADPGEPIAAYAWTVDGAQAGTEPTLNAAFQTAGDHTVVLTVTDPTGRQRSASHTIAVTAAPTPSPTPLPPTSPAGDTTAPAISGLAARPARVRSGRRVTFGFQLSEAAAVQLEIQRAVRGRRDGAACRKPTARNRTARRCTRQLRVAVVKAVGKLGTNSARFSLRTRGRALPAGRYRAVVIASDATGNRSIARRVSFTIQAA